MKKILLLSTIIMTSFFGYAQESSTSKEQDFRLSKAAQHSLETFLSDCLKDKNCDELTSVSALSEEELDVLFGDFSADAKSQFDLIRNFGDELVRSIEAYKGKVIDFSFDVENCRYGHSEKVKLIDLKMNFHISENETHFLYGTFLYDDNQSLYAIKIQE